jgi:Domain of unknown function DUF29
VGRPRAFADQVPAARGNGSPKTAGRRNMRPMPIDRSYDGDLVLWAEDQARALRDAAQARINLPIDWENVAEEIESLGKLQGRELASRIGVIVVHLMKLQASPAAEPRAGWRETIIEQRNEIRRLMEDSPSLRQTVDSAIAREISSAAYQASTAIRDHGEAPPIDLDSVRYSAD